MKTLIVYYSRTGVTKKVSETLKQKLNCDIEEIVDTKDRQGPIGYMLGGRDALKEILTEIKPTEKNPDDYELVIIGTPVWASNMAPAVRTYIAAQKAKLKKVAFLVTYGGSGFEKTLKRLGDLAGVQPMATLGFKTAEVVKNQTEEKINQFIASLK